MSEPIQAGSLNEGPLDMVAYWTPLDGGLYEVTATFIARGPDATPKRTVMAFADGDDIAFSIPGYLEALYRFQRRGEVVEASVEVKTEVIAAR